jgi:xanthine dehydrogenase accessory factor
VERTALIAAAGSTRAVLERLQQVDGEGQVAVLAWVVRTEGSTYRKRGALALIEADGRKTGVLSGGCLELQLVESAVRVLRSGAPDWLVFDSMDDDDLLFGSGSGCRGRTQVLLWPLQPSADAVVIALLLALAAGGAAVQLLVDLDALRPAPRLLSAADVDASHCQAALKLGPLDRIWMVGAGAEAALLAQLLRAQGWWIGMSEHRAGWREAVDLGAVDTVLAQRPIAAARHLLPADVLLIMSHNAQIDLEALRIAASSRVTAVGLLGPPARRDALLLELDAVQREQLQGRLFAPVGLRLGGEGPLAIALSISAWLLGVAPR